MPVTMPHASIGEAIDALSKQDRAIQAIPEVESVVGKIGRVESALDPAPVSMVETVVNYKPEYVLDKQGRPKLFRHENGEFVHDEGGQLIEDPSGQPYRQWRPHIHTPDDIWRAINEAAQLPGSTTASKIQPIANRIVMLQTGVRAEMAVRILGDSLQDIEKVGMAVERLLKEVPSVNPDTVIADRIMGKPYIEIEPDRQAIARYGATIRDVQDVIETAIGGQQITTTVEGRRRFPVRVRYQRELRDTIDSLGRVLVAASEGRQIPLAQMATIRYVRGPEMIKSEDTRLVGYVIFDKYPDFAQIDVVEACREYLDQAIADGRLELPAGVQRPTFIGNYENQIRSTKTLALLIPVSLGLIFIILYFDFKRLSTTLLIWSGVFVAGAGGMLLVWLYSTSWFMDVAVFNVNLRDMFQVHTINLSVAVWVGFIALLGIAEDDGVVISTYLDQTFRDARPTTIEACREATVRAGLRRIRPLLMTGSTTILALLPVLTSRGRGSDVMVPMAIPSVGGMTIELMTLFVVPVTYCLIEESKIRWRARRAACH
jgi:Cu(I)/Ag(I) efflux system membrane protein CusA/SilA